MTIPEPTKPQPEDIDTVQALQEALRAAQMSLKTLQGTGDQANTLKAARACADIAQKLVKVLPEPIHKETPERKKLLAEIYQLLIDDLEGDYETREAAITSLRAGIREL